MDKIIHFLWLLVDLPNGSIWSNLAASLICLILAGITAFIARSKIRQKIDERFDRHSQHIQGMLDDHHEKIKSLINGS